MQHISVSEFSKIINNENHILLDVRSIAEYKIANIGGTLIPLDELEARFNEIDLTKTIYCLCHHGMRSQAAAGFLEAKGAVNVFNIEGGIDAYSCEIDGEIERY